MQQQKREEKIRVARHQQLSTAVSLMAYITTLVSEVG